MRSSWFHELDADSEHSKLRCISWAWMHTNFCWCEHVKLCAPFGSHATQHVQRGERQVAWPLFQPFPSRIRQSTPEAISHDSCAIPTLTMKLLIIGESLRYLMQQCSSNPVASMETYHVKITMSVDFVINPKGRICLADSSEYPYTLWLFCGGKQS